MNADEFREIREDASLSIEWLANLLGVDEIQVRGWESGERRISGPVEIIMETIDTLGAGVVHPLSDEGGMDADELRAIAAAGSFHDLSDLGDLIRVKDKRTLRRWLMGRDLIPGPTAIVLRLVRDGLWPPQYADPALDDEVF